MVRSVHWALREWLSTVDCTLQQKTLLGSCKLVKIKRPAASLSSQRWEALCCWFITVCSCSSIVAVQLLNTAHRPGIVPSQLGYVIELKWTDRTDDCKRGTAIDCVVRLLCTCKRFSLIECALLIRSIWGSDTSAPGHVATFRSTHFPLGQCCAGQKHPPLASCLDTRVRADRCQSCRFSLIIGNHRWQHLLHPWF